MQVVAAMQEKHSDGEFQFLQTDAFSLRRLADLQELQLQT